MSFRSRAHFQRAVNDLTRWVRPGEAIAAAPSWGGATSWASIASRVRDASWVDARDVELVFEAALALDRQVVLWGLDVATHLAEPAIEVRAGGRGGRGVFATRDLDFGETAAEYSGRTIVHGDDADAMTAMAERHVVHCDVSALAAAGATGAEFAAELREAYRKLNGFPAALAAEGYEGARPSTLIFGGWRAERDDLFKCGAMVNDPAALLLAAPSRAALCAAGNSRTASANVGELGDIDAAVAAYQREALSGANASMVPSGGAMYCVAARPIAAGEELLYPYGSTWWLGHAREATLDTLALAIFDDDASVEMIRGARRVIEDMERASHAALDAERGMLGRSGAMERSGVAPLASLPTLSPPILALKLLERVVRLTSGAADALGDNAAGTRTVSPAEGATRTPMLARADLDAFRARWPSEL